MYEALKGEFDFYVAHQAEFVQKHNGKVIALKNHEVVGVYDDEWTAVQETSKAHAPGTFIVQLVTPGTEAYTIAVASNFALNEA